MPRRARIHLDGVHLLVTPGDAQAVPRMMVALGRRYVPYINASYQRSGTLWEGRYKSSLIQSEAYLLAGMSSYRANALGESSCVLTPHALYATLAAADVDRQAAYRELFDQVLSDKTISEIRLALNQTQPLGNSRFFDAIEQATGQRREAKPRGRPRKPAQDAAPRDNPSQMGLADLDG